MNKGIPKYFPQLSSNCFCKKNTSRALGCVGSFDLTSALLTLSSLSASCLKGHVTMLATSRAEGLPAEGQERQGLLQEGDTAISRQELPSSPTRTRSSHSHSSRRRGTRGLPRRPGTGGRLPTRLLRPSLPRRRLSMCTRLPTTPSCFQCPSSACPLKSFTVVFLIPKTPSRRMLICLSFFFFFLFCFLKN